MKKRPGFRSSGKNHHMSNMSKGDVQRNYAMSNGKIVKNQIYSYRYE